VKVKLPTAHLEQPEAKKVYEAAHVPLEPLSARVAHIVQSCFDGRRIVIFSGGPREDDQALLEEVTAIRAGGGFGSIIGRNSFQGPKPDAIKLLGRVLDIYAGGAYCRPPILCGAHLQAILTTRINGEKVRRRREKYQRFHRARICAKEERPVSEPPRTAAA
jgi:hypothetical protein